jgi:hypothetical protein
MVTDRRTSRIDSAARARDGAKRGNSQPVKDGGFAQEGFNWLSNRRRQKTAQEIDGFL